ncbi:MAG: ATP-binding protein [Gammaproteobacteria bacterium]|nr:ATP-binding protein [Gammaproteobacteria bacterium]
MLDKHGLIISNNQSTLAPSTSLLPYFYFLKSSLKKQLGEDILIKQSNSEKGEDWYWVDIPESGHFIRFGFPRSRIGVNPPIALIVLLISGIIITFIATAFLSQRLSIPIERLYNAARAVSKGHWPDKIEEDGPEELIVLTKEFNRMNVQVKTLLSNRTTLLAGISHDLRTPLTQIQLALSMLPNDGGDKILMESIQEDIVTINQLIGETLSISMELEEDEGVLTDVSLEINSIIKNIQTNGIEIRWSQSESIRHILHPLALRRILTNLLTNAVRYGEGQPITINCSIKNNEIIVEIMDRGKGIEKKHREAIFQPFYRLEKSQSSKGLGLAIVKQLADTNRWDVQLLPHEGGGTNARLSIPL